MNSFTKSLPFPEVLENLFDLQNISGGQAPQDLTIMNEDPIPHEAVHVVQQ